MKFLISSAYAAAPAPMAAGPAAGEAFMLNMMMIGVMVLMFYVLMIRPQQKRFKEHRSMLDALKKGDQVLTSGGLIGKVDSVAEGKDEVVVDLGNGIKVTALRSTIQMKMTDTAKAA